MRLRQLWHFLHLIGRTMEWHDCQIRIGWRLAWLMAWMATNYAKIEVEEAL